MSDQAIADNEVLYRRIPPGLRWFEPPDRPTSASFKLRKREDGQFEEGLSVYRAAIISEVEVLVKPEAIEGSTVAQATAGEIRGLRNAERKLLNLSVVAVCDENDPGHAEVRGPVPRKLPNGAPRALKGLFRHVEVSPDEP